MELLSSALYLLLTFVSLQVLVRVLKKSKTKNKMPLGPTPLPVIGNLLQLGGKPHESLAHLAQSHGPIMSLKLGQLTTIVLSSSTAAKEVLQKLDISFSNRFIPNAVRAHAHDQYSSAWLPVGDTWRSLRKIMNSCFLSSSRLENSLKLRERKVKDLIDYVKHCGRKGVAVNIGRTAFTTSVNILSNILFSVDLVDPSQDSSKEFKDMVWMIMVELGKPNWVDYFPMLAKLDPQGIYGRLEIQRKKLLQIFGQFIDERLELRRLQKAKDDKDVLDILLRNINDGNSDEIDRNHIEHLLSDIFTAGTDTTSSTVEWAMAELLTTPETLKKAKAELELAIRKGKLVKESDLVHLPYLRAIVKETLRKHPPTPLLLPRTTMTNVELSGYTVPKGAQVLVNAWAIGRDPSTWPNPSLFMPERFLCSDIDVKGQCFELIPFGAGRRICPGLLLGVKLVNVMVGSLLNSFDWELEGGISPTELDMEEKFGITLQKAQPLLAIPFHVSQ